MNRLILASVLAVLVVGGMIPGARGQGAAVDQIGESIDPDLLGWWAFDEEAGIVAGDSSGRGHDGRLCNGPVWVAGRLGPALQFDGVDDYVEVPHSAGLVPSGNEVSVAAWINAERYGGPNGTRWQGILAKDDSPRLYNLYMHASGALHFSTGLRGNYVGTYSTGLMPLREWVHVVALVKDYQHAYYINGEPAGVSGANAILFPGSTATLTIGRTHEADRNFLGMLDDVRLYDRALTAEEVKRMAQPQWQACQPAPADGATGVITALLRWTAGDTAVAHDLYCGMDKALVEAAALNSPLYWGRQADARFSLAEPLQSGGHYFWRVDEVEADGITIHKGTVWTFTVFSPFVVDDFESYTDEEGRRIEEIWLDGSVNGTGAQVSRGSNPSGGGRAVGAHGRQSMLLAYDNSQPPFVSEVEREFVSPQDWTADGADTLSLWVKGEAVSFGETSAGTYNLTAAGTDIWNGTDQFRYACKRLDGDGAIVARIDSLTSTHEWAKCGVMIRKSLEPYAAHASMFVTPDGRRAFQNRPTDWTGRCLTAHSYPGAITLPCWVKVERRGNQFAGYYSFDGVDWIQQPEYEEVTSYQSRNPETVDMPGYVYIGLALSSHAPDLANTAVFSGVEMTGDIVGPWQVADIGVEHPGNSPDDLYVVVEDSNGTMAPVLRPNPSAVNTPAWTEWKIPLNHFAGADLSRVRKMTIGVGRREIAPSLGTGRINIDDIRVSKQVAASVLGIYLVDTDELVLSSQDMAAYLRATHEIVLNESGIRKWNSYITSDDSHGSPIPGAGGLYQREFALRIDDREIYRGHFWSALSSVSCEGIVILDALLPRDSTLDTIQIGNGYPGPSGSAEDPRANAELLNFFAALGLLQ